MQEDKEGIVRLSYFSLLSFVFQFAQGFEKNSWPRKHISIVSEQNIEA